LNLFNLSYIFNHKLFKNSLVYTGTNVINKAIPFFLLPIMTRYLTPTDYGIVATFNVLLAVNVLRYLLEYSKKLKEDVNEISESFNLKEYFYFEGSSGRLNYVTKDGNKDNSYKFRTLFSQEMVKNNILMPWIAPSFSHKEKELEKTLVAIEKTLKVYKKALENGIGKYVNSHYIKPVFRKYN